MAKNGKASKQELNWAANPRWAGVTRPYSAEDVERLRGSLRIEYTLARNGAERLWELLHSQSYVPALGAMTGNQAIQQVKAGLRAIYVSGWQVAADANDAGQMYPDQSLYPADSVPNVVRRINQALMRADQIHHAQGNNVIEAGAACVHFEDQLSSAKKCGHLGGKVLVSTAEAIQKLIAARLAADVMGVPTLIMARTDANSAHLLTSDIDPRDHEFLTGNRTAARVLLHSWRVGIRDCSQYFLCAICRSPLVGDFRAKLGRGATVRRSGVGKTSRQTAGLQLFAVL